MGVCWAPAIADRSRLNRAAAPWSRKELRGREIGGWLRRREGGRSGRAGLGLAFYMGKD